MQDRKLVIQYLTYIDSDSAFYTSKLAAFDIIADKCLIMDCFIGVDTKRIEEETGYSLADFKHAYFRCFYIKLGTTVCADVADQVEQILGFKLKHPFEVEKLGKAFLFIGAAGVGKTIFFHNLFGLAFGKEYCIQGATNRDVTTGLFNTAPLRSNGTPAK
jgi:hypothetical protein